MQFQKITILPLQKGLEFPGGGGSVWPKNFKKCMMLNWNFQRGGGGGGLKKTPLLGGGMDFFNYTQIVQGKQNLRATHACLQGKVGFKFL